MNSGADESPTPREQGSQAKTPAAVVAERVGGESEDYATLWQFATSRPSRGR